MVERRSPKGPAPMYSRGHIAAAAVRLADRSGLPAVTMRGVAAELGTGGGSLYRYVSSRNDLLDLMVDAVTAEVDLTATPSGRWTADLVTLGHSLLDLHRRHRWLVDVQQRAVTAGPHVVDYLEHCLALLAGLEVSVRAKMEAVALLTGVVTLFARQEAAGTTFALTVDSAERWPLLAAGLGERAPTVRPTSDLFDRVVTGMVRGVLEPPA